MYELGNIVTGLQLQVMMTRKQHLHKQDPARAQRHCDWLEHGGETEGERDTQGERGRERVREREREASGRGVEWREGEEKGKGRGWGGGIGRAPCDSLFRTPSAHLGSGPHVWPDPSQGRLDVAQGGKPTWDDRPTEITPPVEGRK